jgi:hypothetical protein
MLMIFHLLKYLKQEIIKAMNEKISLETDKEIAENTNLQT